jgi:hypothetical protein
MKKKKRRFFMINKPNLVLPDFKEFNLDSPEYSDFLYSPYVDSTTSSIISPLIRCSFSDFLDETDNSDTVTEITVIETVEEIPLGHPDNPVDTIAKLVVFHSLV